MSERPISIKFMFIEMPFNRLTFIPHICFPHWRPHYSKAASLVKYFTYCVRIRTRELTVRRPL